MAQVDNSLATLLFNLSPRLIKDSVRIEDFYKLNVWLFAGIGAIVRNIIGVPFEIRKGPRNSKQSTVVESGPWVDLFDRPCPILTRSQFWEAILVYLNLPGGECIVVKEGRLGPLRSPDEQPAELWPLPGSALTPKIENGIPVEWKMQDSKGEELKFKPWQIIHLKRFNPNSPNRGLGAGDVAAGAVRRNIFRDRYNEGFFIEGAVPEGAFVSDQVLTKTQKEQLETKLKDEHKGADKAHRFTILSGGMKWVSMGSSHKDMAFIEQGKWDQDEVLSTLGVPKSEIGLEVDTSIMTGAGHLSRNRQFWIGTLIPTMTLLHETFWVDLFKQVDGGTQWGQFNTKVVDALRGDRKLLLEQMEMLLRSGFTQHQVSDYLELDLPETELWDVPFMQSTLTPADQLIAGSPAEETAALADAEAAALADTPPPKKNPAAAAGEDPIALDGEEDYVAPTTAELVKENLRALVDMRVLTGEEGLLTELEKGQAIRTVRNFFRGRSAARDKYWRGVVRRTMEPTEPKFARRTRRYFMELRVEQLRRLKKLDVKPQRWAMLRDMILHASPVQSDDQDAILLGIFDDFESRVMREEGLGGTRDTVEEVLFPRDEWDSTMKKMHHPIYVDVVTNAMDQAFVELGGNFSFDTTDPKVVDVISKREEILVQANGTIRRQLARDIEEGVKNGESIREIQERVRLRFNGFTPSKSLAIARTEVAGATNGARHETFAGEGVSETQWITARDEAVRESHREQDGDTRPLGQPFPNGLDYPGQPGAPASEVINCRCVAAPIS